MPQLEEKIVVLSPLSLFVCLSVCVGVTLLQMHCFDNLSLCGLTLIDHFFNISQSERLFFIVIMFFSPYFVVSSCMSCVTSAV